jgi:hypothetical protein
MTDKRVYIHNIFFNTNRLLGVTDTKKFFGTFILQSKHEYNVHKKIFLLAHTPLICDLFWHDCLSTSVSCPPAICRNDAAE